MSENLDELFRLYSQGEISISEVKMKGNINQYQFVEELAKRNMEFVYPKETEETKERRIKILMDLMNS